MTGVPDEENLVTRALLAFRDSMPQSPRLGWEITKRIPLAAGLGGASSDAAAALVAANVMSGLPLCRQDLTEIAATLGSDIPFFLGSPLALSSGRGTKLESLPNASCEILLLVPRITIAQKTKALYTLIRPSDYSDGHRSAMVVDALNVDTIPTTASIANAFSRPLASMVPDVLELLKFLESLDCGSFGLSGAGPTHYILPGTSSDLGIQPRLKERFGEWLTVIPTRIRQHGLDPAFAHPHGSCDVGSYF